MPILYAELQVAGRQVACDTASFSFEQPTDEKGRPSSVVRVGFLKVTISGEAAGWSLWEQIKADPYRRESGHVVFFENEGMTATRYTFYDATLVSLEFLFDAKGTAGKQPAVGVELHFSAATIDVHGVRYEVYSIIPWPTDPKTSFRALTKPADPLPSLQLRAQPVEGAPTDWIKQDNWAGKSRSREGYKGGRKLERKALQRFRNHIQAAYGVQVEIVQKGSEVEKIMNKANGQAGFMASTRKIYVRKGATHYELSHEMYHAEQWHQLGDEGYKRQTRLEKETYVYNRLMEKEQGNLTAAQRQDAINYVNDLREEQDLPPLTA